MDGVLRVGGRIDKAEIPWELKQPVILDHYYHRNLIHTRVEHVFPISAINTGFCIVQTKLKAVQVNAHYVFVVVLNLVQKMANLPNVRFTVARVPFRHAGVNYAGHYETRVGRNRKEKRSISLFKRLYIRTLYLEVTHNLDTDSSIIALRKFPARRGIPVRVMSDKGSGVARSVERSI